MGPVVSQLEREFAGSLEVRRYVLDKLAVGSPEHALAYGLAERVKLDRTPTYLIADTEGRVRALYAGATSYLSLRGAIQEASARPLTDPRPSR